MKIVDQNQIQNINPTTPYQDDNSLNWNDITVYNEMADQTSQKLNLLEHMKKQMAQLQEMSARRQFLTKELMNYFSNPK